MKRRREQNIREASSLEFIEFEFIRFRSRSQILQQHKKKNKNETASKRKGKKAEREMKRRRRRRKETLVSAEILSMFFLSAFLIMGVIKPASVATWRKGNRKRRRKDRGQRTEKRR
jgi:hypothetical protein